MYYTALYTVFLALIYMFLTIQVISMRRTYRLPLLDANGKYSDLTRAIRAHGNFSEYVPFGLLMIFFCEQQQAPVWLLNAMGAMLILGRISHIYSIRIAEVKNEQNHLYRELGMMLTFGTYLIAILYILQDMMPG